MIPISATPSVNTTPSPSTAAAPDARTANRGSIQEREVHRYYQPWLAAHGSSLSVASHVDSIAQADLLGTGYRAKASRDKALTAFAQLVCLRLDVKRAMVSLIDSTSQYILAEATQSNSIVGGQAKQDDELWLGSAILSRPDAVCEHCMFNVCSAKDEDGQMHTARGLIVNDCREDSRFKDRPYVVDGTVRFYVGVPLLARNGHMIGACAVSDDEPRDGLAVDQLKLMQETAQSVMEHLEWARDRVDRFKGERIVRGMASFIESCSSLGDGPLNDAPPEEVKAASTTPATTYMRTSPNRSRLPPARPALVSRNSARRIPHHLRQSEAAGASSSPPQPKGDSMGRMFARAAEILRASTLADGAAIFGATSTSAKRGSFASQLATDLSEQEGTAKSPGFESDRHDTATTSDSDSAPGARPCKILAFSLADDKARADIESGSALTLTTLEKYFNLFPRGKTFSFMDDGLGFSSEDESGASDREGPALQTSPTSATSDGRGSSSRRARRKRMDHKELLKKIPGAKTVVFLPLYDHTEEKLMAGCFLWTSVTGRMMSLDSDLSYLRAYINSVMGEVIRMNMQRNEAAKTTFIASMSHELRSPLHGILGAAEFLMDTASDAYQSGLITSISTCGKTLLDTLNHVLDYSKINKLGRAQMRRHAKQNKLVNLTSDSSLDSLNLTAELDLGILVEEVAEAVTAGHAFKNISGATSVATTKMASAIVTSAPDTGDGEKDNSRNTEAQKDGVVSVLLDISPKRSWMVRTQPGALRRIIMNLLGNALKYTTSGFVAVSLRAEETGARRGNGSNKINALLRVVDSGKGMSEVFQRERMFVPFSQEDAFQPGTGLGLSIVKQIVDSLGGSIEVHSQPGIGTEIDVRLSLPPADENAVRPPDDDMLAVEKQTKGLHLVLLDPEIARPPTHHIARLEETLREVCTTWFGMRVTKARTMNVEDADIYMYSEPPAVEHILNQTEADSETRRSSEVPVVIVYTNAEEALSLSRNQQKVLNELGRIVEVIPQPCGPRKLAKILAHCLRRAEEVRKTRGSEISTSVELLSAALETLSKKPALPERIDSKAEIPQSVPQEPVIKPTSKPEDLAQTMSQAVSYPSPPPFDPATPSLHPVARPTDLRPTSSQALSTSKIHVLLVDDNKINRQLLVMFMKKHQFSYAEAENGLEALEAYKSSCLPGATSTEPTRRFDYVLMDISMPVMDGMESTRRIREFENEIGLDRAHVIALTGLASAQAQTEAMAAGIDVFLPKPVKFAELKKMLTQEG